MIIFNILDVEEIKFKNITRLEQTDCYSVTMVVKNQDTRIDIHLFADHRRNLIPTMEDE